MGFREIIDFVKIEHTLFSLPFILIGYIHAHNQFWTELSSDRFGIDIVWILVAAVGARGLAMSLNRIIDRDIDAANPRTKGRHLASGTMTMSTAWTLSATFLGMLLFGAWQLNDVALKMAWLPVLAFVVYPYTKRYTWLCHFWLGLCLGLAPAAAWVAVTADVHGWEAITGGSSTYTQGFGEFFWYPEIFWISLGVALWIASFDLNYARMDIESDMENGIHSFPSRFGERATTRTSIQLSLLWFACFAISNPIEEAWFLIAAGIMCALNIGVVLFRERLPDFQTALFRVSMLTGWVLLASIIVSDSSEIERFASGM